MGGTGIGQPGISRQDNRSIRNPLGKTARQDAGGDPPIFPACQRQSMGNYSRGQGGDNSVTIFSPPPVLLCRPQLFAKALVTPAAKNVYCQIRYSPGNSSHGGRVQRLLLLRRAHIVKNCREVPGSRVIMLIFPGLRNSCPVWHTG